MEFSRLGTDYHASTTLSPDPFLWHWLAVTGALFLLSAAMLALWLRWAPHPAASPSTPSPGVKNGHHPVGPPAPPCHHQPGNLPARPGRMRTNPVAARLHPARPPVRTRNHTTRTPVIADLARRAR